MIVAIIWTGGCLVLGLAITFALDIAEWASERRRKRGEKRDDSICEWPDNPMGPFDV